MNRSASGLLHFGTGGSGDQREPSSKGPRFWQLGVRLGCTEVVRAKGPSGVLTPSARVSVGGRKEHARQVDSVSEGKGRDGSGAHTSFWRAPKFKSKKAGFAHLRLGFLVYRKGIKTPFPLLQDDLQRPPQQLGPCRAEPRAALSLNVSAIPPASLRGWICKAIYDALSISVLAEERGGGRMEPGVLSISHRAAISKEILIVSSDLLQTSAVPACLFTGESGARRPAVICQMDAL